MNDAIRILCVDDEKNVLKSLYRLFIDEDYELLTASSGEEGLETIRANAPVQLVISDYRMPEMNGVDFLRQVFEKWPDTVRIVLSGYADTASVVAAINEGQIYKFVPKPWNDDELKVTVKNAVGHYLAEQKNRELTRQLKEKNQELEILNQNLERMVEMRTSKLMFRNRALAAAQNILNLLPLAVIGIDVEGLIVQCNRRSIGANGEAIIPPANLGAHRRQALAPRVNELIDRFPEDETRGLYDLELGGRAWRLEILRMSQEGQEGMLLVFHERNHE